MATMMEALDIGVTPLKERILRPLDATRPDTLHLIRKHPSDHGETTMRRHAHHLALALSLAATSRSACAQRLADLPLAAATKYVSVAVESIADSRQSEATSPVIIELPAARNSSSRAQHVARGALIGFVVYGALAGAYVIHERATCHGPDCFGEGFAWIGLAVGVPISIGVGAGIGVLWPTGS